MHRLKELTEAKVYIIGDEDTVVGFLMAGIGSKDGLGRTNYKIITAKVGKQEIEQTFNEYKDRRDCGIIIINQHIAEQIRTAIDLHSGPIPAIIEIPSKEQAYDPNKDSVTQKIKVLFGET
ncbi:vacuolar ATP synthase subunit F, putative [Babesia bigemina]|uniref:V-type proton ATPase subunit F n=1 Tax=Babesia bigemina TaxID=5866 RepID=A0A061DD30_BABBI|nr:vacuolar ATP synthase subunit F, putative [Babesia bigemina]CDR97054.1 vacuolar ATP synthase subunit F, putative [Babesia bigemina]|eukprot:XP_012769240.1 vacuolar ATP synthase subunit F, putative [Babesia bigemina]